MAISMARVAGCAAVGCLLLLGPVTGAIAADSAGTGGSSSSAQLPAGRTSIPSPGQLASLSGTWCASATSCWAVGHYVDTAGAELNQALRWNGQKWSAVATPDPGGASSTSVSSLLAVTCTSAANCWAVGSFSSASERQHNQALRWDGSKWTVVPTPGSGGTAPGSSNLAAVACTSATNCWAVGQSVKVSTTQAATLNQALHWNGSKWAIVATSEPGGTGSSAFNALSGVFCTWARNCWAVGRETKGNVLNNAAMMNQALHWTGRKWYTITTPDPGGSSDSDLSELVGVSCASRHDCWAVGDDGTVLAPGAFLNQALNWNGQNWSVATVPNPAGTGGSNGLSAVTCTAPGNCWAVGSDGSTAVASSIFVNLALRWNGHTWAQVSTPNPAGTGPDDSNSLAGVHCAAAATCWAVGNLLAGTQPSTNQALRWNGTEWTVG